MAFGCLLPVRAQEPAASQETTTTTSNGQGLVLGPGDRLVVAAPDIEELDRRELKVQSDGSISVPLVGPMQAKGLTPQEFNEKLTAALKTQFRDPHISFTKVEIHSKPVTVLGEVNTPGVVQADGRKRLLEILSLAGGVKNDAGPILTLARKSDEAQSLPSAFHTVASGNYVTATVPLDKLLEGSDASANIVILPGDVITVPKGRMVYVLGDVRRSGGFILGENNELTVLKALSLAQGLKETAKSSHARLMRAAANGDRSEEEIDLKKLLAGKGDDVVLKPDDILYVPGSTAKKVAARSLSALVDAGTGIAIYRQ